MKTKLLPQIIVLVKRLKVTTRLLGIIFYSLESNYEWNPGTQSIISWISWPIPPWNGSRYLRIFCMVHLFLFSIEAVIEYISQVIHEFY